MFITHERIMTVFRWELDSRRLELVLPEGLARPNVPNAEIKIVAKGSKAASIGRECHGPPAAEPAVAGQAVNLAACGKVPQPHGVVQARGGKP
jgi:hypothetical protein